MKPSDLLLDFGRPVAYYPGLVEFMGSPHAVIFFGQIFYWQDKTISELGVYKSQEEIKKETGLTFSQQATARKQLVSRGILIETHKRLQHKVYYRIDCDRLDEIVTSKTTFCDEYEHQSPETKKSISGNSKTDFGTAKSSVGEGVKVNFDLTETTTEITTENIINRENADEKKSQPSSKKAKSQKRAMPEDFAPTEKHQALANELGVSLQEEFLKFTDHHLSKGSVFADWGRALNTWLRNASEFKRGQQRNQTPPKTAVGGYIDCGNGLYIQDW
ncbi:hypothetical protein [Proteus terrae]|uniref:hypothetical protein n=1 Tax=Proteus terrae TaxID=1574161 RepID=UPI00288A5251|nr:hypothetical protein [Proteus terrae]